MLSNVVPSVQFAASVPGMTVNGHTVGTALAIQYAGNPPLHTGFVPGALALPERNPEGDLQLGTANAERLLSVSSTPETANPDLAKFLRDVLTGLSVLISP